MSTYSKTFIEDPVAQGSSKKLLTLKEAANFLRLTPEGTRRKVIDGTLPGKKIGRFWRFLEEDLVSYVRSNYHAKASQGDHNRSKTIWHSTKEKKFFGSASATMESEYSSLLGLATSKRLKNCMIKSNSTCGDK